MQPLNPLIDWCRIIECEGIVVLLTHFYDAQEDTYLFRTIYHLEHKIGSKEVEEVVLLTPMDEEGYNSAEWEHFCSEEAVSKRLKQSSADILAYHNQIH